MADDDDDSVIGLDLNRQPFADQSPSSPPAHGGIVDRIRQLEAVTARANQRQRLRRFTNNPQLTHIPVIEPPVAVIENQINNGVVSEPINRGGEETVRNCKRDISHLAKALEMDLDCKKTENGGIDGGIGNFFDCNICLDMAKDPILTCCGHLFCWGCFYQVPYVDSISKECPVCKGEVLDSNITPIYGNGNNSSNSSQVFVLENGAKIPPRPRARRVEGIRQQNFSNEVSHIPVADALRRIRIGLGLTESNSHPPGPTGLVPTSGPNPVVMSDTGSVSSAINSGERVFVEDLESYVSVADTSVEMQSDGEMIISLPFSSRRNLATTDLQHMGRLGNDGFLEIDLTMARRGSSRRRGVSSFEGQSSIRRRQLR